MLSKARSQNIPIIFVFEVDNEKSKWIPFWEELNGPRKLDKGIPLNFTNLKKVNPILLNTDLMYFSKQDYILSYKNKILKLFIIADYLQGLVF